MLCGFQILLKVIPFYTIAQPNPDALCEFVNLHSGSFQDIFTIMRLRRVTARGLLWSSPLLNNRAKLRIAMNIRMLRRSAF
jgi:hypothetical protein